MKFFDQALIKIIAFTEYRLISIYVENLSQISINLQENRSIFEVNMGMRPKLHRIV